MQAVLLNSPRSSPIRTVTTGIEQLDTDKKICSVLTTAAAYDVFVTKRHTSYSGIAKLKKYSAKIPIEFDDDRETSRGLIRAWVYKRTPLPNSFRNESIEGAERLVPTKMSVLRLLRRSSEGTQRSVTFVSFKDR